MKPLQPILEMLEQAPNPRARAVAVSATSSLVPTRMEGGPAAPALAAVMRNLAAESFNRAMSAQLADPFTLSRRS